MSTATKFLHRDPARTPPWAETCGQIRCLIEVKDGAAAAEVHHVEIHDARLHYHERTDEVYYVIAAECLMVLDEEVALRPGEVVYVPRGVRHKAKGDQTRKRVEAWADRDTPTFGLFYDFSDQPPGSFFISCRRPAWQRTTRKWQKGLSWLRTHQEDAGGWPGVSVNKKRNPSTQVGKFMPDAATAYAILALGH